jgi:hypothetical protein
MMRALLLVPIALVVALVVAVSCQSLPSPGATCAEIPTNGCPTGRGGTCMDRSCAALYDCVNGTWTFRQACENPVTGAGGGSPGTGRGGTGGLGPDGGPCTPVNIDAGGQTDDCMVDLMSPDCPVEAAEGCAENVCLRGCSDFFLCMDGGWIDVAYCTDDGGIVVTQH